MSQEHVAVLYGAKLVLLGVHAECTRYGLCAAIDKAARRMPLCQAPNGYSRPGVVIQRLNDIDHGMQHGVNDLYSYSAHGMYVQDWLAYKFGIHPTPQELRDYRLRWIDSLIERWKDV